MKTAAVILNYNDAAETIAQCERICKISLIDEIILVDNYSTDDSLTKLENFTLAAGYPDKKIHLLKTKRNGGYGYGNNFGVHHAIDKCGCERIIIANPDAVFTEDTVRKMLWAFGSSEISENSARAESSEKTESSAKAERSEKTESSARTESSEKIENAEVAGNSERIEINEKTETGLKIGVVGALFQNEGPLAENNGKKIYALSGWKKRTICGEILYSAPILKRLFSGKLNFNEKYYLSHAKSPVFAVHGSLLMVSAEAFKISGGYDENVFLYKEEDILGHRMEKAGFGTVLLTDAGYSHKGSHSITGSGIGFVKRQRQRQISELYYYKNYLNANGIELCIAKIVQKAVYFETKLLAAFGRK